MSIAAYSPHRRIIAAGCTYAIAQHRRNYRVSLWLNGERLAFGDASRTGGINTAETLDRIEKNLWGPTTSIYVLMCELADIAEAVQTEKTNVTA